MSHATTLALIANLYARPPLLVPRARPLGGRPDRGPQPSLRWSAVVHVDGTTPAGVASALHGLPERGYPSAHSESFHPKVPLGWVHRTRDAEQETSFTDAVAPASTARSEVGPSGGDG